MVVDMVNRRIAILTDSTCDIPSQLLEEYSIYVQSHVLIWDGCQYRDRWICCPKSFTGAWLTQNAADNLAGERAGFFTGIPARVRERSKQLWAILVNSILAAPSIRPSRLQQAPHFPCPCTTPEGHRWIGMAGFGGCAGTRCG